MRLLLHVRLRQIVRTDYSKTRLLRHLPRNGIFGKWELAETHFPENRLNQDLALRAEERPGRRANREASALRFLFPYARGTPHF